MKEFTAILIDDEESSIITLEWQLQNYTEQINIIGKFTDPEKAIKAIKNLKPDILFLDIHMPRISGFQLLEKVTGFYKQVVFITAFDDYAIKAFEVSAIDYLLKPIDEELLQNTISKLIKNRHKDTFAEQLEILITKLNQNNTIDKIALPTMEGLVFIKPSEILYCKADSNYTTIYMYDKKEMLISKTLKDIENIIHHRNFFRVHQSYLVNLNYLSEYYKGKNAYVVLENGQQIPVSRNKKNNFLDNI